MEPELKVKTKTAFLPYSTAENNTSVSYKKVLKKLGYKIIQQTKLQLKQEHPWKGSDVIIPPTIVTEENFVSRMIELTKFDEYESVFYALEIARFTHLNQKRSSGISHYMGHILPTAQYYLVTRDLLNQKIKKYLLIACLLHDVLEDSNGSVAVFASTETKYCLKEKISDRAVELINILTKKKIGNRDTFMKKYTEGITKDKEACLVKSIDRILNLSSDVELHKNRSDGKIKRYLEETDLYYMNIFDNAPKYYREVLDIVLKTIKIY